MKYGVNCGITSPRAVMSILLLAPSGVKYHSTGGVRLVLQFRRSKVPGVNVVSSGFRISAPYDPDTGQTPG